MSSGHYDNTKVTIMVVGCQLGCNTYGFWQNLGYNGLAQNLAWMRISEGVSMIMQKFSSQKDLLSLCTSFYGRANNQLHTVRGMSV